MNELLAVRISSRFVFVNILPTIAVALLVGGLLAAGAPERAPTWATLTAFIEELGLIGALIIAIGVLAFSVVLHPLAYPMIRLLEGYWSGIPFSGVLGAQASRRYEAWRDQLRHYEKERHATVIDLIWLPPNRVPALPTSLGNALQAGEIRAGERYGYRTGDIWHRVALVLSPTTQAEVTDTRDQLDTAARLCTFALLCVPATLFLLWSHGAWLLVPFGCYLFAWAAYRAAVAAAQRFSEAVAVAIDFHRLQVWDALSLDRPQDLREEQKVLAPLLCQMLRDAGSLYRDDKAKFRYLATPPPAWPGGQWGPPGGQQQTPPPVPGGGVSG